MNQSLKPKSEFQKTGFSRSLAELATNLDYREACEKSLLNYITSLPSTDDPVQAAANWHRVEGALEVIDTLLNLAEVPKPPDKKSDFNLKT